MKKLIIIVVSLLATTLNAAEKYKASDLVGVWRLTKSENPMPDGTTVSYCSGVHGYIMYSAEGYLSVSLNCGKRVNSVEPADISDRKFFYAGTYTVSGLVVTHHLENASDTQLIGTDSKRTIHIEGSLLVLTGENQGQKFSAYWKKVK